MMHHHKSKRSPWKKSDHFNYMSLLKKKPTSSSEKSCKKPRRWGCFRISVSLIALVFFVATVVTTLYVLLFTDLLRHLFESSSSAERSNRANDTRLEIPTSTLATLSTKAVAVQRRDLRILVMIIDTRLHNVDNNAFKQTTESWRKIESVWKEMYEKGVMTDKLTVMQCQGCETAGIKEDQKGVTIFYSIKHLQSDSHSFNTVIFVALPTPPGEVLATVTRHGRNNHLGDLCQKGSWSSTGCDFRIRLENDPEQMVEDERREEEEERKRKSTHRYYYQHRKNNSFNFSFRIQPVASTESELLRFNKTIVMQKDFSTFKVLINQPMAV